MKKLKIIVFTGAGVDKESGIQTFRDSEDGIWNNHKVEDVATIDGWKRDREKVLKFYNQRRAQLKDVEPNLAHKIIAELEDDFDVTVVTQNVTDLHERAGSTKVIHLHGQLNRAKSTFPGSQETYNCTDDIKIGDKCSKGSQLRHDICFFGEMLNTESFESAINVAKDCELCIVVGTSMQVAPANQIPFLTKPNSLVYFVDPSDLNFYVDKQRKPFIKHIKEIATVGMEKIKDELKHLKDS